MALIKKIGILAVGGLAYKEYKNHKKEQRAEHGAEQPYRNTQEHGVTRDSSAQDQFAQRNSDSTAPPYTASADQKIDRAVV
jgi:uncharacterized membrane protein YebE (DUF533 family)